MADKQESINFEQSMKELEEIVKKLEAGDLTLEDSLKHFERGVKLTRQCQKSLNEAEQKVSILMKENEAWKLQPFNESASSTNKE